MLVRKHSSLLHVINESMMATLALISGYFLVVEMTRILTPDQLELISRIDVTIALIFMTEFFVTLHFAKNRNAFLRSRWWELLAAIPFTTPTTQALRLLRLMRIVRVFRIGAHLLIAKESK